MRGWRGCRDDQPEGFTSSSLDLTPRYQTAGIVNRDRATDEGRSVVPGPSFASTFVQADVSGRLQRPQPRDELGMRPRRSLRYVDQLDVDVFHAFAHEFGDLTGLEHLVNQRTRASRRSVIAMPGDLNGIDVELDARPRKEIDQRSKLRLRQSSAPSGSPLSSIGRSSLQPCGDCTGSNRRRGRDVVLCPIP